MPDTPTSSLTDAADPTPQRQNVSTAVDDTAEDPKLSAEDLQRVERYLSSPIHSIERKPFRPWFMMLMLLAVVGSLSLLSLLITWLVLG